MIPVYLIIVKFFPSVQPEHMQMASGPWAFALKVLVLAWTLTSVQH